MKKKAGSEDRDLVICNKCMWAVSLLKGSHKVDQCPVCNSRVLELIPVEDYEDYKIALDRESGLSIEFISEY